MSETAQDLGLYLSVPFCRAKCSFCNFASGVGTAEAVARYVQLLCDEIRGARAWAEAAGATLPDRVDTMYFGGGTPSLLAPGQLRAVMQVVREHFTVDPLAEITMEAAPGQFDDHLLNAALGMGVNRISLGVQSFNDHEAQAVGRSHTGSSCLEEFARLRRAGVANLGADLIAGLPYQNEASWERTLQQATSAGLDHLSVYMLEVDGDSRLGREVLGGGARLHAPAVASDDLVATLYESACEALPTAGYTQYEISNFAASGRTSKHNLKYWMRQPYLGLGLDAHSMLNDEMGRALRWANPEDLRDYAGAASVREASWVTEREAFEEEIFLGLRLVNGIPWSAMENTQQDWVQELQAGVTGLCRDGLMDSNATRFWLTPRGRMVSGEIFGELLAGVAA